ncbi:hypothetical protein HMPREF1987_01474 [Peptostreptococcaceae bacterium oral taxon 113 str. W5053]|nr:hypothetical protein HMPREF1987_01474 [Peptostreptococcaceae bacterium oral taxon 113 str. W5053]
MKKTKAILIAGAVLISSVMPSVIPALAQQAVRQEPSPQMEEQQKMQNFEEVIRSLKELNDEEKEQLIQMEKELDPTWKEIEALEDKVSAIYEKVFRGYDEDKLSKEELEMLNKKAEEEAKDLNAKLDVLYGIIEKAHEKNEPILRKLRQNVELF